MAPFVRIHPVIVLVVEDEALVRLELAEWLEELGLIVLEASNADEAIALLNIHPQIDLLLTDIKMPGSMNGVRLANHLKERWPPVKIIFVSGMLETRQNELPANSFFIPKPYEPQRLWGAVAYLTARSQSHSSF